MSKAPSKKGIERRKKARSPSRRKPSSEAKTSSQPGTESCRNCSAVLKGEDRALFVEEEVGRIFCSEDCITQYFSPDIERLESDYFKNLSRSDLTVEDREQYAHLRWMTLQEPDEIWREKTLAGDYRYTLITEFQPDQKTVWCVCICLFLRGEPSFLFMSFPTKNSEMVNLYRKGERMEWSKTKSDKKSVKERSAEQGQETQEAFPTDGLADEWTEDETLRATLLRERSESDIPPEDFGLYQSCLEETLETPDEVWSLAMNDDRETKLYHFIRHYPEEKPSGVWYLVVARETDNEEEIEVLDAFPTRDRDLVDQYRRGEQEIGTQETNGSSRMVH